MHLIGVVTIKNGTGHGSGFIVSPDGKAGRASRKPTLTTQQFQRIIPNLAQTGTSFQAALRHSNGNRALMDVYQFRGKAGQTIAITLKSQDFNPAVLLFYVDRTDLRPVYTRIARNDDRGPADFNAQLNLSLPKDGLYYVGVTCSSRGEQGTYRLQTQGIA